MGSLRFGQWRYSVVAVSLLLLLPACGGKSKPAGGSPFPVHITVNPTSASAQVGTTFQLFATAQNSANAAIAVAFTFMSSDPGILDITPNGVACAGTWNAPLYTTCTPARYGMVQVIASALGANSSPSLIFVHPPIDTISISVVTPVNPPPPACPNQQALPAACNLPFNANASNFCLSQNQVQTLQATAYSQGNDITALVGPFTWTAASPSVVAITPVINTTLNIATNQTTASPATPGQTQLVASASGIYSQPYNFSACNVQCIDLELTSGGSLAGTSFTVSKGAAETITATAVDVQGCIVPKPALSWNSSSPAAISIGTGCSNSTTCSISTAQPGSAAITASCTPPTCNVGFPLNPAAYSAPYVPQPVYPVTAISGLVTGAPTATSVLATSQDCFSDILCMVALYSVSTSTNLPGTASQLPSAPNSLMFDPPGIRAYMGSQFGAVSINAANVGTANNPYIFLSAPGTALGLVTGKVIGVSLNGNLSVFSDTVSTPNQVYVVNAAPASTTPLNINSAIAATFSPDGLKAFILGDGGNTLSVYSILQGLQTTFPLPTPVTSIAFNSTGSFALLAGGSTAGNLAIYRTCDNSSVSIPDSALPSTPGFLTMVPAGEIPQGHSGGNKFGNAIIPNLEPQGLDFFFGLDNSGIDIVATNSSSPLPNTLCPQQVGLAHTPAPLNTPFDPVHIDLSHGTFHPINFFLSPDATRAYIVTTDQGVLIYDFTTAAVSTILLINNASPVAAGITVDGTMIYVAGTDGLLHELNTSLILDQNQTTFLPLPSSPNSFCYTGANCALNLVAVKP